MLKGTSPFLTVGQELLNAHFLHPIRDTERIPATLSSIEDTIKYLKISFASDRGDVHRTCKVERFCLNRPGPSKLVSAPANRVCTMLWSLHKSYKQINPQLSQKPGDIWAALTSIVSQAVQVDIDCLTPPNCSWILRQAKALIQNPVSAQEVMNWSVQWALLYPSGATMQQLCILHSDVIGILEVVMCVVTELDDEHVRTSTLSWSHASTNCIEYQEIHKSSLDPFSVDQERFCNKKLSESSLRSRIYRKIPCLSCLEDITHTKITPTTTEISQDTRGSKGKETSKDHQSRSTKKSQECDISLQTAFTTSSTTLSSCQSPTTVNCTDTRLQCETLSVR